MKFTKLIKTTTMQYHRKIPTHQKDLKDPCLKNNHNRRHLPPRHDQHKCVLLQRSHVIRKILMDHPPHSN